MNLRRLATTATALALTALPHLPAPDTRAETNAPTITLTPVPVPVTTTALTPVLTQTWPTACTHCPTATPAAVITLTDH